MLLLVPIAFIRKHKFNIPNKTPGKAFMVVGPTRLWLILHTLNILHRGYSTNPTSWPWRTPRTIGNAEDLARSFDVVVPITICSHTWKPVSRIKLHARKGYFQPSRNRTPHCRTAAGQSFHWCGETSEAAGVGCPALPLLTLGGWMSCTTPTSEIIVVYGHISVVYGNQVVIIDGWSTKKHQGQWATVWRYNDGRTRFAAHNLVASQPEWCACGWKTYSKLETLDVPIKRLSSTRQKPWNSHHT